MKLIIISVLMLSSLFLDVNSKPQLPVHLITNTSILTIIKNGINSCNVSPVSKSFAGQGCMNVCQDYCQSLSSHCGYECFDDWCQCSPELQQYNIINIKHVIN